MTRKKGITEVDVSGGGFIDDRGRHVNTDVPEGARRSGSAGKSNAKKRLKQKQSKADQRKREIEEEDEASKSPAKKKKRKKKTDDRLTLDPEKEKVRKRKKKSDASKVEEKEKEKGKKKKRKKKTVGELLKEGKTEQARKKMNKLSSKAMVVSDKSDPVLEISEPEASLVEAVISSEAEFLQEYYHIYGTLGSIIRNLEQKMTQPNSDVNSKDVYALMTMYSQMRETIADLRSIKDMNEQAEDLAQHVFDPAAKSAGEALVNLYFKVSSSVRQKVDDPSVVEEIVETLKLDVGEQASKLQDQFDVARGRIVDILNGGS